MATFDELVTEGSTVDVSTWGAGFPPGRYVEEPPPWDSAAIVAPYLPGARTMLDMGTGDGSELLNLRPLPRLTVAHEEWAPTIPAAMRALQPGGVSLVRCQASVENTDRSGAARPSLPFRDGVFDVVVNRHECFLPADVHRILRADGVFVTEQVGGDQGELREVLGLGPAHLGRWDLAETQGQVEGAGPVVIDGGEASLEARCTDVGALVAYLRSAPWEVSGFTVARYRDRLHVLYERDGGEVRWRTDRFWLAARRPAPPTGVPAPARSAWWSVSRLSSSSRAATAFATPSPIHRRRSATWSSLRDRVRPR